MPWPIAVAGFIWFKTRSPTVSRPPVQAIAPASAGATSSRPEPLIPAMPRISP